jgi:transcriptional regulator with XRE-family HTH domain
MQKLPDTITPGEVFGRRLREERERRRLTLDQLAERVAALVPVADRLDPSTIARIERGDTKGRLDTVMLLAAALGVAPVDLIVPQEDDDVLVKIGTQILSAIEAREWMRGERPLPGQRSGPYFAALPASKQDELVRRYLVELAGGSQVEAALAGWLEPDFAKQLRVSLANRIDEELAAGRQKRRPRKARATTKGGGDA